MLHEHVKAGIHLVSLCNSINNIESKTDLQLFYITWNFACFFIQSLFTVQISIERFKSFFTLKFPHAKVSIYNLPKAIQTKT